MSTGTMTTISIALLYLLDYNSQIIENMSFSTIIYYSFSNDPKTRLIIIYFSFARIIIIKVKLYSNLFPDFNMTIK